MPYSLITTITGRFSGTKWPDETKRPSPSKNRPNLQGQNAVSLTASPLIQ